MTHKKHKTQEHQHKEPELMVQISEPAVLRRDILEGLRDLILFMQGSEQFKSIQAQKQKLYADLRSDLRQINSLIHYHLSRYLPRGKLRGLVQAEAKQEELLGTDAKVQPKAKPEPVLVKENDPFAELEGQLKDIEKELQEIR